MTLVNACTKDGKRGIVEENNLYIGPHEKNVSAVTKEKFNDILDKVGAIYSPIISAKGKTLKIERKWDDGTVNAYAQQAGNIWSITMFGGLARHETITPDAFALVACHELGHHLGGIPKKKIWIITLWASNEGQSDYFGTMKCLRKYFENDDNLRIVEEMEVDEYVTKTCNETFASADEIAICQRSAMAGHSLGSLFNALGNAPKELSFTTPDPKVVTATDHNHPAAQCRLDTYFAAAICDKDAYTDVSDTDASTGLCARSNGYQTGVRPLCWYKP